MYNEHMVKFVRKFLGLLILLSLLVGTPAQAQKSEDGFRFFDETKHNVKGAFLVFYEETQNAEVLLGYPITEEFKNSEGVFVQYFQRARLEMQNGSVVLSPLGELTYQNGVQLRINNPLACRFYDTGFPVCFTFLQFFDQYGGLEFFGYPISPFEFYENKVVQYFQNGRLEWNPSRPEGQRVVMADLGSLYFEKMGEDAKLLDDALPLRGIVQIVELDVQVFLDKAVADATDDQLIYIIVRDQTGAEVKNIAGQVIVHWTTGEQGVFPIVTGNTGLATLPLSFENQIYGELVTIDIEVSLDDVEGASSTSFRIWY